MGLADRLHRLHDALLPGSSLVLTWEALGELLAEPDEPTVVDLTVGQVAQVLGLSAASVRRRLETQRLKGYRSGVTWYVPASALAEYRAEQEKGRPMLRAVPVRRREAVP